MKRRAVKVFLTFVTVFLTVFAPASGRAELESYRIEIDQPFGGSETPDDARMAAVAKGRFEVTEKAGRYVESVSVVENFVLTQDESISLASGVLKTQILEQKNYATENGFGLVLKLEIQVDGSMLQQRLEQIRQDRQLMSKYQEIEQRERQLIDRIRQLEDQNRLLAQGAGKQGFERQPDGSMKRAVDALEAADLNRQALSFWQDGRFSDPEKVLAMLNRAVTLDPTSATALNNRGVLQYRQAKTDEAIADYSAAIDIDERYEDAYHNRAMAFFDQRRYGEALADLNRALEINPDNAALYLSRAKVFKQMWQYRPMVDDFSSAMKIDQGLTQQPKMKDSLAVGAEEIDRLCEKAEMACQRKLCRALDYLHSRGFCR